MNVAVYKTRASVEGTLHLLICARGLSKLPAGCTEIELLLLEFVLAKYSFVYNILPML